MREEFPSLGRQLALALQVAVQAKNLRWVALLRWAGADPLLPVPWDLSGDWEDADSLTTAACSACWRDSVEIFDALKIQPTPEQALDLLKHSAWRAEPQIIGRLLKFIPRERINDGERNGSEALEDLVRWEYRSYFGNAKPKEEEEARRVQCIELLLDHGARWDPSEEGAIRYARRGLSSNSARHIVRVVRLLLYTPGACNASQMWELCRTEKMKAQIKSADSALWKELSEITEN